MPEFFPPKILGISCTLEVHPLFWFIQQRRLHGWVFDLAISFVDHLGQTNITPPWRMALFHQLIWGSLKLKQMTSLQFIVTSEVFTSLVLDFVHFHSDNYNINLAMFIFLLSDNRFYLSLVVTFIWTSMDDIKASLMMIIMFIFPAVQIVSV